MPPRKHPIQSLLESASAAMSMEWEFQDIVKRTAISRIPNLDKNQKFELGEDIKNKMKSIDIFRKIGFKFVVDNHTFDPLPRMLIDSKYSVSLQLILLFYQCVVWSFDTNHVKTNEELLLILFTYQQLYENIGIAENQLEYTLRLALKSCLNTQNYKFTETAIINIIEIFDKSKFLTVKMTKIFNKIIILANALSESTRSELITFLVHASTEKRPYFVNANLSLVYEIISQYVSMLDSKGLMVFGYMSQYAPHEIMVALIGTIPYCLFTMIPKSNRTIDVETTIFPMIDIQNLPLEFFDMDIEGEAIFDYQFPTQFSFTGTQLAEYSERIANALIPVSNKYRELFFKVCEEIINKENKTQVIIFACLIIMIIEKLTIVSSVSNSYQVITESFFMSSQQNIFEKIDNDVSFGRQKLFKIITRNSPELIFDVFARFPSSPLLIAEFIVRLFQCNISKLNLKFFANEGFVNCFITSIYQLSDYKQARSTIFYFLNYLVQINEVANICLSSQTFVKHFYRFLFNRSCGTKLIPNIITIMCNCSDIMKLAPALNFFKIVIEVCAQNCMKDKKYVDLAYSIIQLMIAVGNHHEISSDILRPFFLKLLQINLDVKRNDLVFEFLYVITKNDPDFSVSSESFSIILQIINETCGQEPSDFIYEMIGKITNRCSFDTNLYLPIFTKIGAPLAIGAFGLSKRLKSILNAFVRMVDLQSSTIFQLHELGVDVLLIQYFTMDTEITYVSNNDYQMPILLDEECEAIAIHLISRIVSQASSQNILSQFTQMLQHSHAKSASLLIDESFGRCASVGGTVFPLGFVPTQFCIENFPVNVFHKSFSIKISLCIDTIVLFRQEGLVELFKIVDCENSFIHVFFSRNQIFVVYDDKDTTTTSCLMRSVESGKWCDLIFSFKIGAEPVIKVTTFSSLNLSGNSCDTKFSPFVGETVKIYVGGHEGDKPYQQLGQFCKFKIYTGTFNSIEDDNEKNLVYDGSNLPLSSTEQHYQNTVVYPRTSPLSILEVAQTVNYANILSHLLRVIEQPEIFNNILSIMRQIFSITVDFDGYERIITYILDHPHLICFDTFKKLLNTCETLPEELHENFISAIIGNLFIWAKSSAAEFERIVLYYAQIMNVTKKLSLTRYLGFFCDLFGHEGPCKNESETRKYFVTFLNRLSAVANQNDAQYLLELVVKYKNNHDMLIVFQNILSLIDDSKMSSLTQKEEFCKKFLTAINSNPVESAYYFLIILKLTQYNNIKFILAAVGKLEKMKVSLDVFNLVFEKTRFKNELLMPLCFLSLGVNETAEQFAVTNLADLAMNDDNSSFIMDFELWYMSPIIIGFKIGPEVYTSIISVLVSMLSMSDDRCNLVKDIYIFIILVSLAYPDNHDFMREFIDQIIQDQVADKETITFILFSYLFLRLNGSAISPMLNEEFEKSCFYKGEKVSPKVVKFPAIQSFSDIGNYLNMDFKNLVVMFNMSMNGNEWIDLKRAEELENILSNTSSEEANAMKFFVHYFIDRKTRHNEEVNKNFAKIDAFIVQQANVFRYAIYDYTYRVSSTLNDIMKSLAEI